ncbi:helix-turn-helix transcriptional regulator [Leptolyngbya sp. AN02str]|uniref:helix-turn-helix transcriptional regulator n=1 Tax=Leptolyngbya sp. AN02str TaxID=3423363 RepID=UPI003D310C9E
MAIALSNATWRELWAESRQQASQADLEDAGDRIAQCPAQFATGYKRDIALRNGIDLTLHRYELYDDLVFTDVQPEDQGCVEFVFNLSSRFRYWDGVCLEAGQHCLHGVFAPESKEAFIHFAQEPTLEVDIHLEPAVLQSLLGLDQPTSSNLMERLPLDVQRIIAGESDVAISAIRHCSPTMRVVLQQILDCPYQGMVKQLYLESKSLEMLALWLNQVLSDEAVSHPSLSDLRSDDVDRIHHAREILMQQMEHPPSLADLARQVGLNDCTLKRRFRQVFGTTVFGYLHHYRMEQARSLLRDDQLSVTAIARRVGYNNLCAFSTAFRKKFGVSPREMRG